MDLLLSFARSRYAGRVRTGGQQASPSSSSPPPSPRHAPLTLQLPPTSPSSLPLVSPHRRPPTPGAAAATASDGQSPPAATTAAAAAATRVNPANQAPRRVQGAPVARVVPAPSGPYYHAPTKLSNRKLIHNALVSE
jgi:hypothetical protein